MPNILVKEISAELLREVNYAASGEGLTQREWILKILAKEVSNGGSDDGVRVRASADSGKGASDGRVPKASGRARAVDAGSVARGGRPDRGGKGKGEAGKQGEPVNPPCPKCGKAMKDYGTMWCCETHGRFPK